LAHKLSLELGWYAAKAILRERFEWSRVMQGQIYRLMRLL